MEINTVTMNEEVFEEKELEFPEKSVRRQVRRNNNATHARRKQAIAQKVYGFDYYKHLHAYSENKIHCSCPLCAGKTSKKNVARKIVGSFHKMPKNYKPSEIRKFERDVLKLAEATM